MTRAIRSTARNELRTLLPLWAAAVATIVLAALTGSGSIKGLAIAAYALGCLVIGAQVVGHEFSSRTVALMLSQPIARNALFGVKLAVSATMVLTLTAAASQTVFAREPGGPQAAFLVTLLSITLAPALTLLCRSGIAGVVFSIGLSGLIYTAVTAVAILRFGSRNAAAIDAFVQATFWPLILALCACAAAGSWRMFARMQAIDGPAADVHLPTWLSRSQLVRRQRHPVVQLIAKELRLQQMPFVLAALFLAAVAVFGLVMWLDPEVSTDPAMAVTMLYLGCLPVVVGSLASAEERHMGTAQWQLLMPMAAWKQWAVKAAVAMGIALLLAVALPWAASSLFAPSSLQRRSEFWAVMASGVLVLVSGSLFVSSVSSSGLRALVVAVPSLFAGFLFLQWSQSQTFLLVEHLGLLPPPTRFQWYMRPDFYVTLVGVPLSCALLVMGYYNHRAGVQSIVRAASQVVVLALLTMAISAGMFIAGIW